MNSVIVKIFHREIDCRKNVLPRSACFTILELLIVIAIIVILAALLLPALNSAQKKGLAIMCVNNLFQTGRGIEMYQNDSNGLIVANMLGKTYPWQFMVNDNKVKKTKSSHLICPESATYQTATTYQYHTYAMALMNGAAQAEINYYESDIKPHTGDFAIRPCVGDSFVTNFYNVFYRMSRCRAPSRLFLVSDSQTGLTKADSMWYRSFMSALCEDSGVAFTHGNRANLLFADGHVASLNVNGMKTQTVNRMKKYIGFARVPGDIVYE